MEDFKAYLLSKYIVPKTKLAYYISWVTQFYTFCGKNPGDDVSSEEIDRFLKHLTKSREDWQVDQANEAIQFYIYYKRIRYKNIQELLGHTSVQTTMIYTHVTTKNKLGVKSPLDTIFLTPILRAYGASSACIMLFGGIIITYHVIYFVKNFSGISNDQTGRRYVEA